jgi:hypothetical protein
MLLEDLRFEHMDKGRREEATFRFVCLAHLRRDESHVENFISEWAREPICVTCFFPVEHLTVAAEIEAYGVRFIPVDAAPKPGIVFGPDPMATAASVIAVDECIGTDHNMIGARAHPAALHALRVLRAVLRESHFIQDRQLRFRLGDSIWFSDGASGWTARPEEEWGYELSETDLKLDSPPPVTTLPLIGTNDVERAANRALEWFERAQLAVDPVIEILFLTFAVEAIVGRKSDGLKGRELPVRRAVLAHKTTGSQGSGCHPAPPRARIGRWVGRPTTRP